MSPFGRDNMGTTCNKTTFQILRMVGNLIASTCLCIILMHVYFVCDLKLAAI